MSKLIAAASLFLHSTVHVWRLVLAFADQVHVLGVYIERSWSRVLHTEYVNGVQSTSAPDAQPKGN